MYKIVGQSINMRYLGTKQFVSNESPEYFSTINKIVQFGDKYGYKACIEAFMISKSTYYNYKKLCTATDKPLPLRSKRPINVRKSNWNKEIVNFIVKIRLQHANIGKDKIKYYLDKYCLNKNITPISASTIGRIINSFTNKLRTKKSTLILKRRNNVLRKPKNYKPRYSGECVSLDSMEFRQDGKKLYVVVAQDEATNLLYARATHSHTSRSAKDILELAHNYLPWTQFNTILTDNGCEFAKDFASFVKQNDITHYHTYPKTPKQNARCERVNRTIQDEFMIKYGNLLFVDINLFNRKLDKYLRWYNFERVHYRFGNKMTPFEKHRQLVNEGKSIH
jgi:transposase InsO family protein